MHHRGDIILVNLNPRRNDEAGKIRPCVIVSDSDVNEMKKIESGIKALLSL